MSETGRKTITLEVDPRSEPITGSLAEEDGVSQPFVGWLAFASALQRLVGRPSSPRPRAEGEEDTK